VTFTPSSTVNYNTVSGSASVTVNRATPTVSAWPAAGAITYGQTLASSTLSGGSASVGGSFAFTTPSTAPGAGTASQSVTFTPTDSTDNNIVSGSVSITVNKATPTVSAWPTASVITYGQTLASSTLSGGSASVGGSFAFNSPSSAPGLGTASQSITFTPTDSTDNNTVSGSVIVTVNQATPTISISDIPSSAIVGGSFAVTYNYSGNGSPTESVSSGTTNVCTVLGITVSYVGVGTCTLQASATATTDYTSVTGNAQSFIVSQIPPTINTIAGNGTNNGYNGDGELATSAELTPAGGVAVDSAGNIYIADFHNQRIRKVTVSTGDISTVAGNGTAGYSGDGGSAISAELQGPSGVALDSAGNIYIADEQNNRIRKVTVSTGYISTVAGTGTAGYSGDGGAAISAKLNVPYGVAVDSAGNIYIADEGNNRIRKVTSTGAISTVAGNGTAGYLGDGGAATSAELYDPFGVGVDGAGNIYIADFANNRIREVTASTGYISTVAGNGTAGFSGDGGAAISAELNYPIGVAVDSAGNIYITDGQNERIRKVAGSTGTISTIAGNGIAGYLGDGGAATSSELNGPTGVAVDASDIYITDAGNNRIRSVGSGLTASISISCSPGTMTYGSSTTCTATLAGSAPTGIVTFTHNSNSWTSCTLSSGSCSVSGLSSAAAGSYTIIGNYSGDTINPPGSGSTSLTINPATPTISVATSRTPSTYGDAVTFTTTVTSGDTNTVTFYSGSTAIGTVTPSNGTATLITSNLAVGSYGITASIAEGGNYNSATSSALTQTISTATKWDSGTVALNVINGSGSTIFTSTTNYGQSSTPESVAEGLAGSNSSVNVTAVNDTLYIEGAGTGGANTDYSYTVTSTWNSVFTNPSFQGSPASGNLEGGVNASSQQQTIYSYCIPSPTNTNCTSSTTGYDPVGNVVNYIDSVQGTLSFSYDTLNRLATGTSTPPSGQSASPYPNYCWSYDAFGNRLQQMSASIPFTGAQGGANACSTSGALGENVWAQYNGTINGSGNNQVSATSRNPNQGQYYDAAGNPSNDGTNQYLYDAEGRICAEASTPVPGLTAMTGYVYDAEGNRAAKGTITTWSCDPSANGLTTASDETDYVLGPNGQHVTELAQDANGSMNWQRTYVYAGSALIATYSPVSNPAYNPSNPSAAPESIPLPSFRLTDWLGTMRATTDSNGVLQSTCTGLPFGDGAACQGNTPDPRYYTGKERDAESGNDYFNARYMASSMGRFLSPDPTAFSTFLGDPQSWNRYMYGANNPLRKVDRNGLWPTDIHNQIIDNAFPGLTAQQRQNLKDVSAHQDSLWSGGQGESKSYQHAMRSDSETVQQAESEYNKFVSDSETSAAQDQVNFWKQMSPDANPSGVDGLSSTALSDFGLALHAVADSTSPAHIGFQEWKWYDPMGVWDHHQTEANISPFQMQNAVNVARQAFRTTFGDRWYFMAIGCHSWITTDKVGGGTESTCAD
jgi:RHS repeat-associated protein